jgi:hypothetical protein
MKAALLACGGGVLAACSGAAMDWRAQSIDKAETKMRAEVGDAAATFSEVQVTGDRQTGQICGKVKSANAEPARFVVYIDGTAGPFMEGGRGKTFLTPNQFDFSWRADCLNEGYKP